MDCVTGGIWIHSLVTVNFFNQEAVFYRANEMHMMCFLGITEKEKWPEQEVAPLTVKYAEEGSGGQVVETILPLMTEFVTCPLG